MRKEAQSEHASTDSEKEKKIYNLELKIVSLNVTIDDEEKGNGQIKLDLNGSESHVNRFFAANLRSSRNH